MGETAINYNPKRKKSKRKGGFKYANPSNPIPAQLENSKDLEAFFRANKGRYIPYSGSDEVNSHTLQHVLSSLPRLSPTLGGVLGRIKSFSLGGKIDIIKRIDPVFNLEADTTVGIDEKMLYHEFLIENIKWHGVDGQEVNLRTFGEYLFDSLNETGDAFVEVAMAETLGLKSVSVHIHKNHHCLYRFTPKGQIRHVAISPKWDLSYTNRYPPELLPVHPNYIKDNGVSRTMLHVKNGNYAWYGRPKWIEAFQSAFLEFKNLDYKLKETDTRFVGTALIEVEDNDPSYTGSLNDYAKEDGYDTFADQLSDSFTAEGDNPMPFMFMTRGYKSGAAFVKQFKSNTNESWFESTGESIEKDILRANEWSSRLIGDSISGGLSNDIFISELKSMGIPTMKTWQGKLDSIIDTIHSDALNFLGNTEFGKYATKFTSPFAGELERLANQETSTKEQDNDE